MPPSTILTQSGIKGAPSLLRLYEIDQLVSGPRLVLGLFVDAGLANNSTSWQSVAGYGMNAAPYFRIFNPITQGEKFDSKGHYTRKFVPELEKLPSKYLFKPWETPEKILTNARIILGSNYPKPIIDLNSSRARALAAYKLLSINPNEFSATNNSQS